jgi:hypothetical protein
MAIFTGVQDLTVAPFLHTSYRHDFFGELVSSITGQFGANDAQLATKQAIRYGPYLAPNNALYAVIQQDNSATGIAIVKSTNGGATWSTMATNPTGGYYRVNSIQMGGTVLYLACLTGAGHGGPVTIARFDTGAPDAWLSDITSGAPVADNTGTYSSAYSNFWALGIRPSGDLIVVFPGPPAGIYNRCNYAIYSGGAWGGSAPVSGQAGSFHFLPMSIEVVQASGRAHIFLEQLTNSPGDPPALAHVTLDAGGTFHTFSTIANDGDYSNVDPFWALSGNWQTGGVDYIGYPYVSGYPAGGSPGSQNISFLSAADADNPTFINALVSNTTVANHQEVRVDQFDTFEVHMSFAADGSTIGLFWVHSEGRNLGLYSGKPEVVYHSQSIDNGATWSAPDAWKTYPDYLSVFSVIPILLPSSGGTPPPPPPPPPSSGGGYYAFLGAGALR